MKITDLESLVAGHRAKVDAQKALAKDIKQKVAVSKKKIKSLNTDILRHQKALEVIKEVGKKTEESIQLHISSITSLALDSIMDDPYELILEFVERRDKIECDIFFKRGDKLLTPLESSGYGAVDIAAFAMRTAMWKMQSPQKRNTLVLDEPFKNLDKTKQEKASQMLKKISHDMGIQFIIVTHEEQLTQAADKIFEVVKKGKISKIK